jgi:pantoate--beta-alanine ligase
MIPDTGHRTLTVFRTPREMQDWTRARRSEGRTIGCVPTMGALHDGHLSLVRASASQCDETIVTIFVNPIQFGPSEDLSKYPRDEEGDLRLATENGATAAYCPTVDAMYFGDRSTYIVEETVSAPLCGKSRPTHFRGVTTVVAKLFNACLPDKAYFGLKDYQQYLVLKRMVRDLDFPVEIVGCPIVREPDGLAMSSRNRYLNASERIDALCLRKALDAAEKLFESGERDPRKIEKAAVDIIAPVASAKIDYVECRDADDLGEINAIIKPAVLALAVFIGNTRLIDNEILTLSREG